MSTSPATTADPLEYQGGELELFQHALNWKGYLARRLSIYLIGDVLEVGAGLGGTTRVLCGSDARTWLCLEPDADLEAQLERLISEGSLPAACRALQGTVADLPEEAAFDAVLYVDVLEHIEDDTGELARAARRAKHGGRLIVLSPAHPWLFSPFDAAIGHFRRYRRKDAKALTPEGLVLESALYLDSVGLLASVANRLILQSSLPTPGQIRTWDQLMVPLSQIVDPLMGYALGRSVLFVWRNP